MNAHVAVCTWWKKHQGAARGRTLLGAEHLPRHKFTLVSAKAGCALMAKMHQFESTITPEPLMFDVTVGFPL